MLRKLFKDSIVYGVSGILSRGISLILVPFYTRVLTPEDYGIVDILTIVGAIVNIVVALEISQGFAIFFSETKLQKEKILFSSSSLIFTCTSYSVFIATSLFSYFIIIYPIPLL